MMQYCQSAIAAAHRHLKQAVDRPVLAPLPRVMQSTGQKSEMLGSHRLSAMKKSIILRQSSSTVVLAWRTGVLYCSNLCSFPVSTDPACITRHTRTVRSIPKTALFCSVYRIRFGAFMVV